MIRYVLALVAVLAADQPGARLPQRLRFQQPDPDPELQCRGQINLRASTNAAYDLHHGSPSPSTILYALNGQNQLTQSGANTVSYDARGDLSSNSDNSYSYDVDNTLTKTGNTHRLRDGGQAPATT